MKKIILKTRRPWSWKVFLVLAGLIIPAVFALVPFTFFQLNAYRETGSTAITWQMLMGDAVINSILTIVLGAIGLILANRIGLGLPFVERRIRSEPAAFSLRRALSISWIFGVGIALIVLVLESVVFAPLMLAMFQKIGNMLPQEAIPPPLYGLLASFSAGVTEETTFRLFGLSLLAWLGGLLFHDAEGRPKAAVFWTASLLFALAFGAMHLPAARAMGWPINTLVVTRTIILNGLGGLVLGWLFWNFGLETAILAHFFGDIIRYVFLPVVALQNSGSAQTLILIGFAVLVLLAMLWSWRTLLRKEENSHEQEEEIQALSTAAYLSQRKDSTADLAIYTHQLTKDFKTVQALNDLTLEIPTGIIFGFLGPNGAGKTTTLRLLLGLLQPTSGSARILGYDCQTQADLVRANCGALLEYTGIYEQMSAEDNLEFYGRAFRIPPEERKRRIQELLSEMGLWERRKERAGSWSRGMKQKLALARALLHKPGLVLLDEPTAGLDVRSVASIRQDLKDLAASQNVTIFLTSHNMDEVEKLCHQVAVINGGHLMAQGTPDELKKQSGVSRIEVVGRGFTPQALDLIRNIAGVTRLDLQNSHLQIDLAADADSAEFVNLLVSNGVRVEEIRRESMSLEEVFLKLTGEKDV